MNLNPLKKDDNTDALVKALEDANNMTDQPAAGAAPMAAPADNAAAIAADPQVASAGVVPEAPAVDAPASDAPMSDPVSTDIPSTDLAATMDSSVATDQPPVPAAAPDSPVSFSTDNDLPVGVSDDADAHLKSDVSQGSGDNGELDDVKKSALEQLRPLIEKLDLEPADKFDKYLMMLRASDDPALIKPAFDAAQGIGGEKEKAQALLDIINEINYITNQPN